MIHWMSTSFKVGPQFKFLFSFRTNVLQEPCANPGPTFSGPFLAFALLSSVCQGCQHQPAGDGEVLRSQCISSFPSLPETSYHVPNSHWIDLSASWFKLFLGDAGFWYHLLLLCLQLSASQPRTFLSIPPSQPKIITQGIVSNVWKHFCIL